MNTIARLSCARLAIASFALLALETTDLELHAQTDAEAAKRQREERLSEMKRLALDVRVFEHTSQRREQTTLMEDPLMRYTDLAQEIYDSTLWAWGERGRPVAVMKVEHYPVSPRGPRWLCGLVSLSPHRVSAERADEWQWSAGKPGLEPQPIPEAPSPAATAAERLRQMKLLARRFSAYQLTAAGKMRLELRLLAQPIYRYADSAAGLEDGSIFVFANSTNPEVLLVIESRRRDEELPAWHYGLARLCGGEPYVSLDGKEVWKQSIAPPPIALDTYVNSYFVQQTRMGEPQ